MSSCVTLAWRFDTTILYPVDCEDEDADVEDVLVFGRAITPRVRGLLGIPSSRDFTPISL